MLNFPSEGAVIRLRSFRIVVFPAPLGPIIPSFSPSSTSKLIFLTAQNSSYFDLNLPAAEGLKTFFNIFLDLEVIISLSSSYFSSCL